MVVVVVVIVVVIKVQPGLKGEGGGVLWRRLGSYFSQTYVDCYSAAEVQPYTSSTCVCVAESSVE